MEHKKDLDNLTDIKFMKKQNAAVELALQKEDFTTYDLLTKEGKKEDK